MPQSLMKKDSREEPLGVANDFLDAALFMVNSTKPLDEYEVTFNVPWSWYEELIHFLTTGTMPNHLSRDKQKWVAL